MVHQRNLVDGLVGVANPDGHQVPFATSTRGVALLVSVPFACLHMKRALNSLPGAS